MAAEVLSTISGALAQTMAPQLERQWNRTAHLIPRLTVKSGAGQGYGQNVAWDVQFSTGGSAGGTFAEGADVTAYTQDPLTKASLAWGQFSSAFSLSNLEINAAAANIANASALDDMVGERFLGAVTSILDTMESECFIGTGTLSGNPSIFGLDSAIAASGSYGGVATGTYSEWKGNTQANGGVAQALTLAQLSTAEGLVFTGSGMDPDLLVTTTGVHSKYEGLFNATVRTVNDGGAPIAAFQGSTSRLNWRGNGIVRARKCPTGVLYMLHNDSLELAILPWANVPDGVMTMTRPAISTNGKDMETVSVPFKVYPLARTGSAVKFNVEVYAQLKVKRPNSCCRIADISEV